MREEQLICTLLSLIVQPQTMTESQLCFEWLVNKKEVTRTKAVTWSVRVCLCISSRFCQCVLPGWVAKGVLPGTKHFKHFKHFIGILILSQSQEYFICITDEQLNSYYQRKSKETLHSLRASLQRLKSPFTLKIQ